MLSASVIALRVPEPFAPAGTMCPDESPMPIDRDAEFYRLLAEIHQVEGVPVADPPFSFKAVIALGGLLIFGAVAGVVLGASQLLLLIG